MAEDPKILKLMNSNKSQETIDMINACKVLAEIVPEIAKLKMCYFKAYTSQGFTSEQAIELCKNITAI